MAAPNEIDTLRALVKSLQTENATLKQRPAVVEELPVDQQPLYEVVNCPQGLYTADDQLLPEGVQFRDKFGTMVPCEAMMPLNEAAKRRFADWQASLPLAGYQPPLDDVIRAAMEFRPREGEPELSLIDFQKAIVNRAIELRHAVKTAPRPYIEPMRNDGVPLMSNTRIQGRDPRRNISSTAVVRAPVAPADKPEPPVGSRADLLGRFAPNAA